MRPPSPSIARRSCRFFCHWHFLDGVNHYHLAHLDPYWSKYDPQDAPKHWAKVRQAYQAIDRMMATLLEGMTEDDDVVVVSDHGCSPINRLVYMERFLFDKGDPVFKDPSTPKTMLALAKAWHNRLDGDKGRHPSGTRPETSPRATPACRRPWRTPSAPGRPSSSSAARA